MSEIIHWADVIAEKLLEKSKNQRIATGISPSGPIHLGNLREMIIADTVKRAITEKGGKAEIIYVADTLDPLRRRYPFLPKEFEQYVGMPLSEIPDPEGCHDSYADHFLLPFLDALEELNISVVVKRADEMYKNGEYENETKVALENKDKIAKIIKEVTGREVSNDWSPFMPICKECGRINTTKVINFDGKKVEYSCKCGYAGECSLRGGKLTWRVDWAARWKILEITCEPFGKDHAAAGGSYDTGVRLSKEVFNYEPPFPIVYEWIHLKGVGAMKSSKGVVVPVTDLVKAVPPEIIRYLIVRTKPERHIDFDPGFGLLEIIENFEEEIKQNTRNIQLSVINTLNYSNVPFKHLVIVGQIANWDIKLVFEILSRKYKISEEDAKDIERRLSYAKSWVKTYAPEPLRFEIKEKLDNISFDDEEIKFLKEFASRLKEGLNAEEIHNLVYTVSKELGLKPSKAFRSIYKIILGKKEGPRVGYFIELLGIDWVKNRILTSLSNV